MKNIYISLYKQKGQVHVLAQAQIPSHLCFYMLCLMGPSSSLIKAV